MHEMTKGILLALVLGLSGCAGTEAGMPLLQKDNALNVLPSQQPGYDYLVSIRNVKDFGYDPDDKATRDRTALLALKDQCAAPQIVGETVINTGTYALGNPARTYAIQVKC
jgi:hypothetical protein